MTDKPNTPLLDQVQPDAHAELLEANCPGVARRRGRRQQDRDSRQPGQDALSHIYLLLIERSYQQHVLPAPPTFRADGSTRNDSRYSSSSRSADGRSKVAGFRCCPPWRNS